MQTAFEATNPFEFWAKANLAVVAATMELFQATTTASTAVVDTGRSQPRSGSERREVARTSYEARAAEIRGAPTSPSNSSTGKSWYRAPYRSPFDPLFWMTPGHPVDHVSDWMRPAMAAGTALGNPLASSFATPFAAPFGSTIPDWQSLVWMSPMTAWANMMPIYRAGSSVEQHAPTNVVDFETAYAAYRTSGGHASSQILHDRPRSSQPPRRAASKETSAPAWPLPFMMFGWPPRFS